MRTIRFLEYLASPEGQEVAGWGVKGDKFGDLENGPHYQLVGGKSTFFPEFLKQLTSDWNNVSKKCGLYFYTFATSAYGYEVANWNPNDPKMAEFNKIYAPLVEFKPELDIVFNAGTEEATNKPKVKDLIKDSRAKIIWAKDDASAASLFNELVQKCETAGLEKV